MMNIAYIILQEQDNCDYSLGFDDPHNAIDVCVVPWVYNSVLCIDLEVGINGVVAP